MGTHADAAKDKSRFCYDEAFGLALVLPGRDI